MPALVAEWKVQLATWPSPNRGVQAGIVDLADRSVEIRQIDFLVQPHRSTRTRQRRYGHRSLRDMTDRDGGNIIARYSDRVAKACDGTIEQE